MPALGQTWPRKLDTAAPWLVALAALTTQYLIQVAPVSYVHFDARSTLMVSDSLLTRGTLALDGMPGLQELDPYMVERVNGRTYSSFPVGTPVLSIPFVALERLAHGGERLDDVLVQKRIAGTVVALVLLLTYALARTFLRPFAGMLAASVVVLGSSLVSTLGTALWSHDFGVLCSLAALVPAVRAYRKQTVPRGGLIGIALAGAFLCRPTLALMAPVVLWILAGTSRRAALTAGTVAAIGLLLAMAAFHVQMGQFLPSYYLPGRLQGPGHGFLRAAWGLIASPSRGLFVFTPFLAIPMLSIKVMTAEPNRRLTAAILAWCLAHLAVVASFPHWWGGASYGPRLMTDVVPGLSVLLFASLERLPAWPSPASIALAATAAFSIAAHAGQGLFNPATLDWNGSPNVDRHPELIFDWSYPQFMHTDARAHARDLAFASDPPEGSPVRLLAPGETVRFDDGDVSWAGWYDAEAGFRWTSHGASEMRFRIGTSAFAGVLHIRGSTEGPQRVRVRLNGVLVCSRATEGFDVQDWTVRFDPALLHADDWNDVRFELPDARRPPRSADTRVLGWALTSLQID